MRTAKSTEIFVRGVKPGHSGEKSRYRKTYAVGRVCKADDCIAILSTYNKGPLCYAHSPKRFPLARGVRSDSWENDAGS